MIDQSFAHDLKNALGIIIGYADLLLDEIPTGDPRRADVEEIRKAGATAMALLEQRATAGAEGA